VIEEEGTDNFGNNNNAVGTIEALRRTDAAIGVAMNYVNTKDPNTLVLTAADSDAGGMQVFQFAPYTRPSGNATSNPNLADTEPSPPFVRVNPTTTNTSRVVLDGPKGSTGTPEQPWIPFAAKDSIDGPMGNFGIAWVGTPDFPGSIVSKAYGMNANQLPGTVDNTQIYGLMYQTLFGVTPEFAASQQEVKLVSGTSSGDTLIAGANSSSSSFDGINDLVFTGAGADTVDASTAASAIAGNNNVFTGSGKDTIYVGNGDRTFGGSGDDEIYATDAKDYRISGGTGDDIFFLGVNGRALGGEGNDKFYVVEGGANLLSGGAGADQFWILTGDLPSTTNTITDFSRGVDVLGIAGQGANFDFSDLSFSANNILVNGKAIATLTGIQTSTLTAADFAFVAGSV
jgi:glycerophosphoryl diester phosphodiesterase